MIEAEKNDYWCDASIKSNADGWRPNDETFENCSANDKPPELSRFQKWLLTAAAWFKRHTPSDWFKLIGVTGTHSMIDEFPIGMRTEKRIKLTGEFCAYANDLNGFYYNNNGSIRITITRTD